MTPNDKLILTAFVRTLAQLDRLGQKLPADLQGQLNALQDVASRTLELEKLIETNADLATLYRQECDRLMAEASDHRKKGNLPSFESNEDNTELDNLAESICHAQNSVVAAKDALKSSDSGIKKFFSKFFNKFFN